MSNYEYHQLLKFLYFEGYADSYEEAEHIIEEMTDEELGDLYEELFLSEGNKEDEYLEKKGESTKTTAMRKSGARRHRFDTGTTHQGAKRENITWTRPGTRSYDDSLNRQRKEAHRSARKIKKPQAGSSPEDRKWAEFSGDKPEGKYQKLQKAKKAGQRTNIEAQKQGLVRAGERRRQLRTQAVNAIRRAVGGGYVSEESINDLSERKFAPDEKLPGSGKTPAEKMERAQAKQGANYMLSKGSLRGQGAKKSYWDRAHKIKTIKDIVKKGGDPRNDPDAGRGWDNDARKINRPQNPTGGSSRRIVDDSKNSYSQGGLRAHKTKAGGYRILTRKEELEMQEGLGRYKTSAGHWKDRDENPSVDDAVSDMLQKRREAASKKTAQARMKAKGTVPKKDGKDMFESIIEYLFVEGFADTIENAEVMAENISETWVNEIMEAQVDWYKRDKENVQDRVGVLRDRNKRLQSDRPEIPSGRDQTDFRRKRHQDSRGKKGSVTEENYETNVQPPREPLKTDRNMFSISQKEKDAARERTLAKAKAMRAKKGLK